MKRLTFVVSLTNNNNDYQQEQAAAAEKAARRLGVELKIIHADNDALAQSQQLLHFVQDSSVARPDAIMFEPAGGTDALPHRHNRGSGIEASTRERAGERRRRPRGGGPAASTRGWQERRGRTAARLAS